MRGCVHKREKKEERKKEGELFFTILYDCDIKKESLRERERERERVEMYRCDRFDFRFFRSSFLIVLDISHRALIMFPVKVIHYHIGYHT